MGLMWHFMFGRNIKLFPLQSIAQTSWIKIFPNLSLDDLCIYVVMDHDFIIALHT